MTLEEKLDLPQAVVPCIYGQSSCIQILTNNQSSFIPTSYHHPYYIAFIAFTKNHQINIQPTHPFPSPKPEHENNQPPSIHLRLPFPPDLFIAASKSPSIFRQTLPFSLSNPPSVIRDIQRALSPSLCWKSKIEMKGLLIFIIYYTKCNV